MPVKVFLERFNQGGKMPQMLEATSRGLGPWTEEGKQAEPLNLPQLPDWGEI